MRVKALTLVAAAVLTLGSVAQAQEMPKPSPEMAKLDFFEGNWSCEGTIEQTPMSPAGKITSTVEIKDDLGNFWQTGTIRATMANMPPFEGRFYTTYDPAGKRFIMFWGDSMGSWAQTASPGWEGDKMVFQGDSNMPGQKPMTSRDTFTRGKDGSMSHMWEAQMDGKWMTLGQETCRKKK